MTRAEAIRWAERGLAIVVHLSADRVTIRTRAGVTITVWSTP